MPNRRKNLGGVDLYDSVLEWYPAMVNINETFKTGMIVEALKAALSGFNMTMKYTSPEDRQWGGQTDQIDNKTGEFIYTGMVGMLQKGKL